MEEITFEEFEKRWSQLERAKEIRDYLLKHAETNNYLSELNSVVGNKQEELRKLFFKAVESI